jgi:hypothetical protein
MQLDTKQQALLASFVNTDGFKILCGLMKDSVLEFNKKLLAAIKPEDVIIAHNQASAAAKFYEDVLNRVDSEIYLYTATPKPGDKPVDSTEGVLDIEGYIGGING